MPLVAPGITGDVVPQTQDWTNRLMGKTIGDESNATVSEHLCQEENSSLTFHTDVRNVGAAREHTDHSRGTGHDHGLPGEQVSIGKLIL